MTMQDVFNSIVKVRRAKTLSDSDQMRLGALIAALENVVVDRDGEEPIVRFDFGYMFPNAIDSWRGSYDELALNYTDEGEEMKVSAFLGLLKSAVGKRFTGYKGGEFVMYETTPLWVSNYGEACNTAVIGVIDEGYVVILATGYREF